MDRHYPQADAGEAGLSFERLAEARRSCRAFLPTPLPDELIRRILVTAQHSPSWSNTQPWRLTVTSGQGTERFRRMMLAKAASSDPATRDFAFPREYTGEYQDRRRRCGFQLYDAVGIERGDREAYARQTMRNFAFFDAPHVAIVTTEEALGVYGAIDCGGYVSHFMLAAQALGVGTIAQAALANYAADICEFFGMPQSRRVVCGISFGWPDHAHPSNGFMTERVGLSEVVDWVSD
ncbi:nitroreductase [Falsochrobactrum sp. TDYN1]|uniref:Nitroreductase n=1 Tax=Falsochrobactrum tianjinense TaxID=2706015 RepID=A0A949UUE8_9HYPH|nr:nitroreductase [Falsochrobactrum sp. TDYN1]MBV2145109.1 nitroreductase [Falsochrobactrum sp. TDYN1]